MAPYYRADSGFAYPDRYSDTGPDQRQDSISPVNHAIREYFATAVASEGDPLPKGQKDDWRTKPELPTTEEILGSDESSTDIFLLPNNISGPWPSTELYLSAHYNLIREDAIAHLRDAVLYVRTYPEMQEDANISIYEKVTL